jgi:hypothetical protein
VGTLVISTPRLELALQTPAEALAWVESLPPQARAQGFGQQPLEILGHSVFRFACETQPMPSEVVLSKGHRTQREP